MKKKTKTIKEPLFNQSRILEIPMPQDLMEHMFQDTQKLGYESEEEKDYRDKKNKYNKFIINRIKKLIVFTPRQKQVIKYLFSDSLTLTDASKKLGISIHAVLRIRDRVIKKIKKRIKYNFK